MSKLSSIILFIVILFIASFFRLYGVNWDQNQHLHPDERFLTMVTGAIEWPKDLGEFLNTAHSPLNPHNKTFNFFVYGTFPVFFTKYAAEILNQADYNGITLVGRKLSAIFDLGTVILVFLIAKKLTTKDKRLTCLAGRRATNGYLPHLAMFLYSISVLPIQLSHFYAVETYLTFFLTFSFYLLINILNRTQLRKIIILSSFMGITLGLAVASKISAILFLPVIGFGFIFLMFKRRNFFLVLLLGILFSSFCFLTIRFAQPYLFANSSFLSSSLNPKVLNNWKELQGFMKPQSGFPPSVQWFNTTKLIFPLKNMIFWGLGLPLGVTSTIAVLFLTIKLLKNSFILSLTLLWIWELFIYQGIQSAPNIRYFHPIYPFLAILTSFFMIKYLVKINRYLFILLVISFLIWPVSFISIYSRPHSRVLASQWIYENIKPKSNLAVEHWDDGLPMTLDEKRLNIFYNYLSLPLYDPDTQEKWKSIADVLNKTDYILLTSNRLWGSITRVPNVYPITSKYYKLLFDEKLGFKKIAEITSFPSLPLPLGKNCMFLLPSQEKLLNLASVHGQILTFDKCDLYQQNDYRGIVIRDDAAEETFTVYDHPKVLIFKKIKAVDYNSLLY